MNPSLRLTDNARRVLRSSRLKNGRAGFEPSANRMLLALLAGSRTLAARLLVSAGADWEQFRTDLAREPEGPILVEREFLESALWESQRRGDGYIGAEHLLLALSRRRAGRVSEAFDALGIGAERLGAVLEDLNQSRVPAARRLWNVWKNAVLRLRGK